MADKKISQLGATTTPVNADLFAIVQSGVTKKITYQNLVAAIVAETSLDLNQVLTNGNITGGKNIEVTDGDYIQLTNSPDSYSFFIYSSTDNDFRVRIGVTDVDLGIIEIQDENATSNIALLGSGLATVKYFNLTSATASTVPYLDASKNLVSSAITPTELGYLTGASSNLQSQIDALVTGLSWKQAVRVATIGPGTLASDFENGDTIDGVILITGDRILIKDQASATENGIYVVNASGAPTRASDMNVAAEFPSATVAVSAGTTNADTQWVCTNDAVIIGITNITFVAVGGTTYVGTTGKITVTGNVINVGSNIMLLDGTTPLTANWDAGDFEIKFTDFKAKTSSGGSLVSSGGNDCFSFGIGGGATNTVFGALKLDYSTVSRVMVTDASKNLIASSVTDTTLSYLDATSSVQTQLDTKVQTILKSITDVSHTGSTTETKVYGGLINANTFATGNFISNYIQARKSGTAGTLAVRVYVNTTNDLSGSPIQIAQYNSGVAANIYYGMSRMYLVKSATNTEVMNASTSVLNSVVNSSNAASSLNIDWTTNQYLVISIQLGSAADTGYISGVILKRE